MRACRSTKGGGRMNMAATFVISTPDPRMMDHRPESYGTPRTPMPQRGRDEPTGADAGFAAIAPDG